MSSTPSAAIDETQAAASLVGQLLEKAHPLLQEALFVAAVPHTYDAPLFKALRDQNDGRDRRLVDRMSGFSFVSRRSDTPDGVARYELAEVVRRILQRRWIERDAEAYRAVHGRALAHLSAHPDPDPYLQTYDRIYHELFVDGAAGCQRLRTAVSGYLGERRLAEAERVLSVASEARDYLARLESPVLAWVEQTVAYGRARLAQMRGDREEALQRLDALRNAPDLWSGLRPFVYRAHGIALERTGEYLDAIEQYRRALAEFRLRPDSEAEQAFTKIRLGEVHVSLAAAARGYREVLPPEDTGTWHTLRELAYLPVTLPLLLYMRSFLGRRIWSLKAIRIVRAQDWIIARLFAIGYRWYEEADEQLKRIGAHSDVVRVQEELADLYMSVGDSERAEPLLQHLLDQTSTPLSEYRRARLHVLLGQAQLRMGETEYAAHNLKRALPVLRSYEDNDLSARALGLLAETQFQLGEIDESLDNFDRALITYQAQEDVVGATEIAERLGAYQKRDLLSPAQRERAGTSTKVLSRRVYLVRFQHPLLVAFRRASLLFLAAFAFFIPLFSITIDLGNVTLDHIGIEPSPPLQASLRPSPLAVSPSFISSLTTDIDAGLALLVGLEFLAAYVVIYVVLGIAVVARTGLRRVQERTRSTAVQANLTELAVGAGEERQAIPWYEATELDHADVHLFGSPMADNSSFVLSSPTSRLVVGASTAWYESLRDRAPLYLLPAARIRDIGYRILRSKLGAWYLASLAVLALIGMLGQIAPEALSVRLLGTPYSTADAYPLVYLGLVIPTLVWAVYRPLRILAHARPRSPAVWGALASGAIIGLLYLLLTSGQRAPWIWPRSAAQQQVGFVYPALTAIFLLVGVVAFLRSVYRSGAVDAPHYPRRVLALIGVACIALIALSAVQVIRYTSAYHLTVTANARRDVGAAALAADETQRGEALLHDAVQLYDRSLGLVPRSIVAAIGRSATLLQLQQFEDALPGFDLAVQANPDEAAYRLWRGITYHAQGRLEQALLDYDWILARDPDNVNALTARGWVGFQFGNDLMAGLEHAEGDVERTQVIDLASQRYQSALEDFMAARELAAAQELSDSASADLLLAIGYVHYQLADYETAKSAWLDALALDAERPVIRIANATVQWRLATLNGFACDQESASSAAKQHAATEIDGAIAELDRALALDPDDDFSYRTRAQLEYLLRNCPGYDYGEQLAAAIASYGRALELAPDSDLYLQYRARVGWVLARHLFFGASEADAAARAALETAIADIQRAIAVDPDGPAGRASYDLSNQQWHDFIVGQWEVFLRQRGREYYEAAALDSALADARAAAEAEPDSAAAAFDAGLYSLALGDADAARDWYEDGARRAAAGGDARALRAALTDLAALTPDGAEVEAAVTQIGELLQAVLSDVEG